ncbi:MAG: mechanosensitive ion channel [Xanthomonadales bacterium]|nr:mechanosensitive ion channel [Xanthomonadales bacterium]
MELQQLWDNALAAMQQLRQPVQLFQFAVSLLALGMAFWLGRRWQGRGGEGLRGDLQQRLLRPAIVVIVALLGLGALRLLQLPYRILALVCVLAFSMLLIRSLAYTLRRVLRPGPMLAASEQLVSGVIWLGFALYLLGWLQPSLNLLDQAALQMGDNRFSLLDLLSLLATAAVLLILGGLLSSALEKRLMSVQQLSIGFRVGASKVLRFVLILLAMLVALNLVGINLTSLAVFSGALGVGLGFGLQRIASNFISGFILIMDRSIRPGDVITIGDSFGWVQELNARYVVVRNRDGVDTLIPNENLITSEVINWSYSDSAVRLKAPVQISYDDDPEQAMSLMVEVARAHPRVQDNPAPVGRLMGFGDSGIDMELRVWIRDPQEGVNNIRSELNLGIWKAFKQAGITIPFPQRDVRLIRVGEPQVGQRADSGEGAEPESDADPDRSAARD